MGLIMGARFTRGSLLCSTSECSLVVASGVHPYGLACGKYILYLLFVVNTLMPCGSWYTFPLAFLLALAKLKYIHMGHVDATQIDTMKTQI